MTGRAGALAALAALLLAAPATAGQKGSKTPDPAGPRAYELFSRVEGPAPARRAQAIGDYARGCLAGAVPVPETGPSWQVMRLSRNRYWAHPAMLAFIERLGRAAQAAGWAGIYVGDIAQPRGGPMPRSHRSHQTGLDADFWMLPARRLDLSRAERERISSIPVRTADQKRVNRNWTPAHMAILKAAAKDPAVDRIFVAAAVKIAMCKAAGKDRAWLRKIRPLYGHATHFHVRLKCPPGNWRCRPQRPTVAELSRTRDGCDETLTWWVTDYLELLHRKPKPGARKRPKRKGPRDYTLADLPRACRRVIAAR